MLDKLSNQEKKICTTALHLIATKGWNDLSLSALAKAAKIPPARLKRLYAETSDILALLVRFVSIETASSVGKIDLDQSPHDRLFEVLMARFDVLQKHRRAILNIVEGVKHDSKCTISLISAQIQAMRTMLALSELKPEGLRQHISLAGLMGVYLLTFCVWMRDEALDMSRTMAFCDRVLKRVIGIAEIFFRRL